MITLLILNFILNIILIIVFFNLNYKKKWCTKDDFDDIPILAFITGIFIALFFFWIVCIIAAMYNGVHLLLPEE
jgi:uncharacterized membrane protein